ncbi:hypothetical protein TTHERM_01639970 (macronuclear) [Tetrahymena thermophila SB210]|uniref:Uncharacterized protein n=1 Tax=Tetrahymena thermophila (strain SB210) TaxID=312017 RepID=Q227Z0_TETTS|nr:hypothetical protein TTHERM_01639970 [Tetrahymena thermophila SB210]EAR81608.2 hypothetical protein TTHERM_01639970 [Tetrahymena thermophila SB210]|eukprot:XP_001029271.2 hypothetical protein TTHERM_01639970 [Tetrahymena thermophila SB210]
MKIPQRLFTTARQTNLLFFNDSKNQKEQSIRKNVKKINRIILMNKQNQIQLQGGQKQQFNLFY